MTTKTTIQLLDDVDGSPAVESITFGIDGVTYEIDLSEENSAALRDGAFGKYIDAGRRVGGRLQTRVTQLPDARPPITGQERKSIQKWARAKGLPVPADRGRISAKLVDDWVADGRPT